MLEPRAQKQLDAFDLRMGARILKHLKALAIEPRYAAGVKALHGGGFRLRVGDYRILFDLDDDRDLIAVVHVAHRRDVYRRLRS